MKNAFCILLVLGGWLLGGCAGTRYTYQGESYSSSDSALAAQKSYLKQLVSEVKPRDRSIDAKVLLLTPSLSTVSALAINRTGTPRQEVVDYVAKATVADLEVMGDVLKQSKLFSLVEAQTVEHTLKEARLSEEKYSAILYFHLISPSQSGWYLLKPGLASPRQINFDALAKGTPRLESWVSNIEQAYK